MTDASGSPDERPIQLKDVAAKTGYNPASFLKAAIRRGFKPFKLKKGQSSPYYLQAKDAAHLQRVLEGERYHRILPEEIDVQTGFCGVYAIEVPSYQGIIRLKIGWSDKIDERLSTYRTIVPDLRVLRIWTCSGNWCERMGEK